MESSACVTVFVYLCPLFSLKITALSRCFDFNNVFKMLLSPFKSLYRNEMHFAYSGLSLFLENSCLVLLTLNLILKYKLDKFYKMSPWEALKTNDII